MSRPFPPRNSSSAAFLRVNGKIRAREVRLVTADKKQLGVFPLNEALTMARQQGVDLVEISAAANPPVCQLIEFGKFRYEQAKKEKESKKHQHASTVKEIQLSPLIDPHDLGIKIAHAVEFLCEDMKVKIALRFRGHRELSHPEIGFSVIRNFLEKVAPYGQRDFEPKLTGKSINAMITPLPRNKRAKNPNKPAESHAHSSSQNSHANNQQDTHAAHKKVSVADEPKSQGLNNPFANLEVK